MASRATIQQLVFLLLLLASTAAAAEPAATWPQWRGPDRDGSVGDVDWPDQLSGEHLVEQWRVPLGPSYSGPIVGEDRVFVTETADGKFEVVRALDRKTGKQLWETRWEGSLSVPFFAKSNGDWIRATPALDEGRLYVAGMRDVLVCLSVEDGEVLWKVDFVAELGTSVPSFGFVSSPLVLGDHVFVQAGGGSVKLNKRTGKIAWRVLKDGGGMSGSAFSSPAVTRLDGTDQIVVQTRTKLTGVEPEAGSVLWETEIPTFRGMNILTPTFVSEGVFVSSYGGRSLLFKPKKAGTEWVLAEGWNHKSQGYMSTPVVMYGHLYVHLRNQRLVCLDAATGEERWTTTPFGKYWSMVTNGRKLLALDQRGELLLIRGNAQEFELLDRRKIAEDSWAHLAVAGSDIFVRELGAIVAYEWK